MMKCSAAWQVQHGPMPFKRKSRWVTLKTKSKDLMDVGWRPKTHLKKKWQIKMNACADVRKAGV